MRWVAILTVLFTAIAGGLFWTGTFDEGEDNVKADFTILLDEPIAREGGAVILLPTQKAMPQGADTIIQVEVRASGQVSVVQIFYPEGASYTYRFRSANDKRFPNARITSERILAGSSTGIHPDTTETQDIPTVLTHHIEVAGGNWTKSRTRVARTETNLGFLADRYVCETSQYALVCDTTHVETNR